MRVEVIGHHLRGASFFLLKQSLYLFSECCTLQAFAIHHGFLSSFPVSACNLYRNVGVRDESYHIQLFGMDSCQTQVLRLLLKVLVPAEPFYQLLFPGFLNMAQFPGFLAVLFFLPLISIHFPISIESVKFEFKLFFILLL